MNQVSNYELERICDEGYQAAIAALSGLTFMHNEWEVVNEADAVFVRTTRSRLDYRVDDRQQITIESYRRRIAAEARRWFQQKENADRAERDRERADKQRREQEEEAERERAAQIRRERLRREAEEEAERERQEAERKRQEEARREAHRKDVNASNREKLAAIQAKWKAERTKSVTPAQEQTAENAPVQTPKAFCTECGQLVSPTAKFCTNCGTKLRQTCAACGTALSLTAKFCTNCGTPTNQ